MMSLMKLITVVHLLLLSYLTYLMVYLVPKQSQELTPLRILVVTPSMLLRTLSFMILRHLRLLTQLINVTCFDQVPPVDINDVTDEADNCGTPTVAFVSDVSDGSILSRNNHKNLLRYGFLW